MGQAMAGCLFLTIIWLSAETIETFRWPPLVALALCLGYVFSAYFEFYSLSVATVAACVAGRIGITRRIEFSRLLAPAGAIGPAWRSSRDPASATGPIRRDVPDACGYVSMGIPA